MCTTFCDKFWMGASSLNGIKGWCAWSSLLAFCHDSVPPVMIVDNSKEQFSCDIRWKLNKADCQLRQTEPYSPWQQTTKGNILEVKRSFAQLMMKSHAPKVLWDHCLKLAVVIESHTCNSIYSTGGEVPETIMLGPMTCTSLVTISYLPLTLDQQQQLKS